MKPNSFLCLLTAWALPLIACGLFQPGYTATQTAVAETTVAASWTATPTLTPTQTFTPTPTPTETETPTPTPDPCLPENLFDAVQEVNDLQARFDNVSLFAANAQREQLPEKISELQDLLQIAEDQETPPCLEALRDHQLKHMNFVIEALTAFADRVDQSIVDDKINRAREEHDEYTLELIRLLGTTPIP